MINSIFKLGFGLLLLLPFNMVYSQSNYTDSIAAERVNFSQTLLHTDSIINADERAEIESLSYFEVDTSWVLTARFKKKKGKAFEMPTNTERKPKYQRVGFLYFDHNGEKFRLTVYKNLGLTSPIYKNYVFIPFKDANAPETTYGGGRYLDIDFSPDAKTVIVDFNAAYNPYCVYSHRYSCPITPEENQIDVRINAGVKNPVMKNE